MSLIYISYFLIDILFGWGFSNSWGGTWPKWTICA